MIDNIVYQAGFFLIVLLAIGYPLGLYMARVYTDKPIGLDRVLGPVERCIYRVCRVDPDEESDWKNYAVAMLVFSGFSLAFLYALQRLQGWLPLNQGSLGAALGSLDPQLALNTASSFVTNTNWQAYGGETTMTYLTQMLGLTVQNFVSAATGMAVCAAVIRGFARKERATVGNYYKDMVRTTLYILLPIACVLSFLFVWQGMPQTLEGPIQARLAEPAARIGAGNPGSPTSVADTTGQTGSDATEWREIARGPVASQIPIKHLGTNGGGFFNVNSSHPFENPTPFTNLLEMLAILVIPVGLCLTFGKMVRDRRQGWAILAAMTLLFVGMLALCAYSEQCGNPEAVRIGANASPGNGADAQAGGNMEGKETRFGIAASSLFATVTTSASCGAVNSMHDSYTPLGGLVPMVLMQLGEVVYGGVGSGFYGMLAFAVIAVFVAGLMVGRTPEYLGKKIEPFEMKMAAIMILVPPFLTLVGTAAAAAGSGALSISNPGAHGFSEILYAFSSMSNNNGSAFAGLSANTPIYNLLGALCMFGARFWVAVPALALAGSMAAKKTVPKGSGTLPTDGWLFVLLLACAVLVVGALTFFPALALGPIVEHLL